MPTKRKPKSVYFVIYFSYYEYEWKIITHSYNKRTATTQMRLSNDECWMDGYDPETSSLQVVTGLYANN